MHDQIERLFVVKTQVPAVIGIYVVDARRLFHQQMATKSTSVVVHGGPHGGAIVGELGLHELGSATPNRELAGAHFQLRAHQFGAVEIDGARLGPGRPGRSKIFGASHQCQNACRCGGSQDPGANCQHRIITLSWLYDK
jgi:hypothetical protein